MTMNSSEKAPRRNFLFQALVTWFSISVLPVFYVLIHYVIPPNLREKVLASLAVAKLPDIPSNTAKVVKFNKRPVIIVHLEQGQFKAFSAVCTHLGCIVEYKPDQQRFHCNCHGSQFDLTGKNVAGPAPKPLSPYRVEVRDTDVIIYQV